MKTTRRQGFTLIELLVVIAIIAVLIALLLPAVQAAREAARRCQCVNNLMQVGIALQNYQVAHEVLPPGTVDVKGPVVAGPPGYQYGWMVQILPYVEQKNLQKKFNFKAGLYDQSNESARAFVVNSFLCPSDRATGGPANSAGGFVAHSSYMGNHHDVEAPIDVTNNGILFLNSSVRYDDIEDGSSNTIFVGESKSLKPDLGWASGTRASLRNSGTTVNFRPLILPGGATAPAATPSPAPADKAATTPEVIGGYSSYHPGGANFAFGDGSVKFLKDTIAADVFSKLANRHDGDVVSGDKY